MPRPGRSLSPRNDPEESIPGKGPQEGPGRPRFPGGGAGRDGIRRNRAARSRREHALPAHTPGPSQTSPAPGRRADATACPPPASTGKNPGPPRASPAATESGSPTKTGTNEEDPVRRSEPSPPTARPPADHERTPRPASPLPRPGPPADTPRIARLLQPTRQRHGQPRQLPRRLHVFDHKWNLASPTLPAPLPAQTRVAVQSTGKVDDGERTADGLPEQLTTAGRKECAATPGEVDVWVRLDAGQRDHLGWEAKPGELGACSGDPTG